MICRHSVCLSHKWNHNSTRLLLHGYRINIALIFVNCVLYCTRLYRIQAVILLVAWCQETPEPQCFHHFRPTCQRCRAEAAPREGLQAKVRQMDARWVLGCQIVSDLIGAAELYLTADSLKSVGDNASLPHHLPLETRITVAFTTYSPVVHQLFTIYSPFIHLSSWCVSASWNVGVPRAAAWGCRKLSRTFADHFGSCALCSFTCLAEWSAYQSILRWIMHHKLSLVTLSKTCQVTPPWSK